MKKKWFFMPMFFLMLFLCLDMGPVRAEVTSYQSFRQKDSVLSKYIVSYYFEINGGEKYALCIERSKVVPEKGSPTSDWIEIFNEDLRKVLYYGYKGPEDKGYNVVETSCAAAAANGDDDTSIGTTVLEEIKQYESPPASFRVWKVVTNGGKTQDLAFFTTLTTGKLLLKKISADETVTLDRPEYSLEGAIYGVYKDEGCENQVGTLTTREDGVSDSLELPEGTYYLKELAAPQGYLLDENVVSAEVLVERTTTVNVEDKPITQMVDLQITKENVVGEKLSGAKFGMYKDKECTVLVAEGVTNEDGELLVSGLFQGEIYYLKELLPPDGYMKTDEIYEIVADGTEMTIMNERKIVLPNTGSQSALLLEMLGISCIMISYKKRR